ncbi:hypothetical protein [Pseudactinotalea sp.]|uniref:hypothetical protein n=1 Tax=Pseudactinotalea sp. TaxID=1926260 RepID=UPI003B3BD3A6
MARPGGSLTSRLLAPLAGLALAGALIAGCAPAPGTAATVNGQVIGEREVATAVEELSHFFGPVPPTEVITYLVAAPEMIDVAADAGFGMSESDAVGTLDRLAAQNGVDPIEASEPTLLVVRSLLASSALQSDPEAAALMTEVGDRVAGLDVTISPRYGTWDGQAIAEPSFDWIEVPAPAGA